MNSHFISWNVWGLNDLGKRRVVKAALRKWNPQVTCLQETKTVKVDRKFILSIGGGRWADWEHLGASGAAGGILVMWDNRVFIKMGSVIGSYSVSCLLKWVDNDRLCVFSGVYGPCSDASRKVLWEELKLVRLRWNFPWCLGGDFNVIRFSHERSGSRGFSQAMTDFNELIDELELMDLPLAGGNFTWSRAGDRMQWSRIADFWYRWNGRGCLAALFSLVYRESFRTMSRCFLFVGGITRGKYPFRFENMWLKEPDFLEWVCSKWISYEVAGNPW